LRTLYKCAVQSGKSVEESKAAPVSKNYPYNINVTVNQTGVAWFTNTGVDGSVKQFVGGKTDDDAAFSKAREIPAVSVAVDSVNYVSAGDGKRNKNEELTAGFSTGEKRFYTSNKALADTKIPKEPSSWKIAACTEPTPRESALWEGISVFCATSSRK
jgi:hypothetical protein